MKHCASIRDSRGGLSGKQLLVSASYNNNKKKIKKDHGGQGRNELSRPIWTVLISLLEATFSTTNMTFKPASFEEEHME